MINTHFFTPMRLYKKNLKDYKEEMSDCLEYIQDYPDQNIKTFMAENIKMLAKENSCHGNTELAWQCLKRASELGMGVFQSNANDNVVFPFFYDGEYIEVKGVKTGFKTGEPDWHKSLNLALMMGNKEAIDCVLSVDNAVLGASNLGDQIDSFGYALIDLYRVLLGGGDLFEALVKANEAFNPDNYDNVVFFYITRLELPIVDVIQGIFSSKEAYNQAMEKALLAHKEYYDREEDLRNVEYLGAISLPLTALAVIARDAKGYELTVENEYIPQWIVQRIPPSDE